MPRPDRSNALDHVVVIMFENRSFDNLLGRLYQPGEVASFEGVAGLDLSNPVPDWAAGRDAAAPDLAPVLSLETPRDPEHWPEVTPWPVPPFSPARVRLEARLKGLCRAACFPVLALAKDMGLPAPDIDRDEAIGRADAIALIDEVFGHMFPGLRAS